MSTKMFVFLSLAAGAAFALTRNSPPVPPGATAADSAAVAHAGVGSRFEYGVGSIGSKFLGGLVNGMLQETEQSLADLKPAIKATKGPDGARAKAVALKVAQMDSIARLDLEYGRPLKAVKGAMEAKNLVNAIRAQVKLKI